MTDSFTKAARRVLRKIGKHRYSPRRVAFSRAWVRWAKDRPYPELLEALGRVEALLDADRKTDTAALIAAIAPTACCATCNTHHL